MSNPESPQRRCPPIKLIILLLGVLVAAGGVTVWIKTRPDPVELLKEGLAVTQQDPAEGERLLRRAISSAGGQYPDAEIALGCLLVSRGNWNEASSLFAAADKTACRAPLLLDFGRMALQAGHISEAVEALESVRKRGTSESAAALELLAAAYRGLGKQDEAIAAIEEFIQLQPNDHRPRWELIQLLKAAHLDTECLAAIRDALRHNPPKDFRIEMQHQLIELLIVQGNSADAWKEIAEVQKSEGETPRLKGERVDLYRMEGRLDKALEAMTALFPEIQHKPVAYLTRGVIYLDLGRFEEAVRDLERAVRTQPFNEGAQFKLSEAYRGLGQDEPARRHRELGLGIRQKRLRINELLKKQAERQLSTDESQEIVELHRQLGEERGQTGQSAPD
jgi:protein O-GlcNAc transferase